MKERQYRLSLVWFLLLVIVSQATFAQITEWIPVTSPFGDSVAQLWQISDGDLFAAIGNPGTSLIYRSTDDGFTWQFESISIPVDAVSANGTFFAAGSYLGEPFHSSIEHFSLMSTDFGRTWSIPLIITPENVIFAFVPTNGARVFAMGGQTLFASDSEGIDWFEISVGPDIPPPPRLATSRYRKRRRGDRNYGRCIYGLD